MWETYGGIGVGPGAPDQSADRPCRAHIIIEKRGSLHALCQPTVHTETFSKFAQSDLDHEQHRATVASRDHVVVYGGIYMVA